MEPITKLIPLVIEGALLLGATACLPQSLPQILPTGTVTETIPATKTIIPATSTSAPPPSVFGVEMDQITIGGGLDQVAAASTSWVRRNAVVWSSIEPTEGTINWSAMAGLESELQNASSKGMQVILIVRSTPHWASIAGSGSGSSCGPVSQAKLPAFGNFMRALVARYSVAPYNVKYWEMWNEEDFYFISGDQQYGCWGNPSDAYYGGGYYATMLKAVYPQIKAADPQAQVLVGGLLLDCDPRPGAGCATVGHNAVQPKFLEGILRNNGGPYFDGVSFHAYDWYQGQPGVYLNTNWESAWNTTGPSFIAKALFIQSVLSQYGVSGKFLMNTESAILCEACSNDPTFETTKAYYVAQSYAAAIAQGLRANTWYSVMGWYNSGLLNANLSPRPAYTAFQFSRSELGDVTYTGDITMGDIGSVSGVKGYKFLRGDRRIWVLWSLDGNTHLITLSSAPLTAWDALGNSVSSAKTMNVSLNPLYLEWNP